MDQWYIVGHNDFLVDNAVQSIKERSCVSNIVSKTDPEETYFFIKSCPKDSAIIIYGGGTDKRDLLENLSRNNYHLVWHVDKKEQLPPHADKNHIFYAQNLNDDQFIKFVENVLKERDIKNLSSDTMMQIVERLDKGDLYWSFNELCKLTQLVKSGALQSVHVGSIGDSKLFKTVDLFNKVVKKGDVSTILDNLEGQGISAIAINSFFLDALSKMFVIKLYKGQGKKLDDLEEEIDIHHYALAKLKDQSSNVSIDTLMAWHKRFCQLDLCLKYSGINGYTLLKTNLMELTIG